MTTKKTKVKKISAARLRNIALWYLDRYGGTRARVRQVLEKRVRQSELEHGQEPETDIWIDDILSELESLRYLNDDAFAQARIQKGLRQGKSKRLIDQDLRNAGVPSDIRATRLNTAFQDDTDPELEAAKTYVRRNKLGSFRQDPSPYETRDLARLGRRGFSYEVARRALKEN